MSTSPFQNRSIKLQALPIAVQTRPSGQAMSMTTIDTPFRSSLGDRETINSAALAYEVSKRTLDIVGALIGMLLLSPVLLLVAVAVKTTTTGPVLFKQRRLGRGGQEFWCFKFRTMVANAEDILNTTAHLRVRFQENYKIKDDPRTTPIGAWLRKTSLDELPQLLNILGGAMSFIGPRPIVPPERSKYQEFADKLLSVKPGLGGYWQVYGRSDTTYEQRVQMDMTYINERCLLLDLKLLILTAYVALRRQGAY